MKEWRKINMRLGNRIAQAKTEDERDKLRSQMLSRNQVRHRFRLESKIPSALRVKLFERVGLTQV